MNQLAPILPPFVPPLGPPDAVREAHPGMIRIQIQVVDLPYHGPEPSNALQASAPRRLLGLLPPETILVPQV